MIDDEKMIIFHDSLECGNPDYIGGKGYNLSQLIQAGQNVPPWFALSTIMMKDAMSRNKDLEKYLGELDSLKPGDTPDKIMEIVRPIQEQVRLLKLDDQAIEQIEKSYTKIIGSNQFCSVRSSASDEDGSGASFAGLHDSFLFIQNIDDVLQKIKFVWASAYNQRAISFRLQNNIHLNQISIAVIIQKMVTAEISGIMFTANPNNNNVQEILISSLYGAGEGIVSAGLDADLFTFSKFDQQIKGEAAQKTEQLIFDQDQKQGLIKVEVDKSKQNQLSLNNDQVKKIAQRGLAIEKYFQRSQDIEFSIDKEGDIFILQARPITTVDEYGPAAGNRIIWDNSNIIESYSGPTTPMTFSFIRYAYMIVYHCFSEVMGIPAKVVHKNRYVYDNMLGLFQGQVYYNLVNWYNLVKMFPGFNYNKNFMESMMGVKEKVSLDDEDKEETDFFQKYFVELPKIIKLLVRSLINFYRIETLVKEFEEHFNQHYQRWAAIDFNKLPPHELMKIYREMEEELLWNWKTPIINDFYVMIFYGSLKRRCTYWCHDESGSLQNDLICGEGNIESTKPTKLLMEIARMVKGNEQYLKLFQEKSCQELVNIVPSEQEYEPVAQKVAYYLEHYGFRCINELKLEEPSLRETPDFLYQMIQNYLEMDKEEALNPELLEKREQQIRKEAEKKAMGELSKGFSLLPKKWLFRRVLRNARRGVKNRENMRFARTKIYGMIRELLNAAGAWMTKEGIINTSQDIYYLTIDEVWDYIKGTAVTTNLKELVILRKKEFDYYRSAEALQISDHFETYGMAYHRNSLQSPLSSFQDLSAEDGMVGIGCCPGEVTAAVRIVQSPKDNLKLNGEILVAGRTDPGWVPLYPSVSGILIERGSILSHSAIVAREMGIPTIVGIANLMNNLKDGQIVQMDGKTGKVIIQDEGEAN